MMQFTFIAVAIIGLSTSALSLYYLKKWYLQGKFSGFLNKTVVDIAVAVVIAGAIIMYVVGPTVAIFVTLVSPGMRVGL